MFTDGAAFGEEDWVGAERGASADGAIEVAGPRSTEIARSRALSLDTNKLQIEVHLPPRKRQCSGAIHTAKWTVGEHTRRAKANRFGWFTAPVEMQIKFCTLTGDRQKFPGV
jgi:hypothetical protein